MEDIKDIIIALIIFPMFLALNGDGSQTYPKTVNKI